MTGARTSPALTMYPVDDLECEKMEKAATSSAPLNIIMDDPGGAINLFWGGPIKRTMGSWRKPEIQSVDTGHADGFCDCLSTGLVELQVLGRYATPVLKTA